MRGELILKIFHTPFSIFLPITHLLLLLLHHLKLEFINNLIFSFNKNWSTSDYNNSNRSKINAMQMNSFVVSRFSSRKLNIFIDNSRRKLSIFIDNSRMLSSGGNCKSNRKLSIGIMNRVVVKKCINRWNYKESGRSVFIRRHLSKTIILNPSSIMTKMKRGNLKEHVINSRSLSMNKSNHHHPHLAGHSHHLADHLHHLADHLHHLAGHLHHLAGHHHHHLIFQFNFHLEADLIQNLLQFILLAHLT